MKRHLNTDRNSHETFRLEVGGAVQPGNRFVSFVRAGGCEVKLQFKSVAARLFPFPFWIEAVFPFPFRICKLKVN